ncbi:DNA polymerase sliding clamp subunit [Photobacterium aquae]|uniref:DNA polymerase sliding clamp subunit n=1 Tax=Photobacterium aquae TaxID=1195763 RepID=A0A0J1H165_9GAMM|nr:DNA starvation/stationary phase protection protein [Photobacterium aquae]KLV05568.1 DNA polymerase sliding clamp subunit [Photobacterium aquae]
MEKNLIGLDKDQTIVLSEALNKLLADYQLLYMNVRGYHWNIKGRNFFELHAKFEEMYNDLILKVDELAERILTLGSRPVHGYSKYLALAEVPEKLDVTDGTEAIRNILDAYKILILKQRRILASASELGDEGTVALMSDYIGQQEKETWMLNAYLQ